MELLFVVAAMGAVYAVFILAPYFVNRDNYNDPIRDLTLKFSPVNAKALSRILNSKDRKDV